MCDSKINDDVWAAVGKFLLAQPPDLAAELLQMPGFEFAYQTGGFNDGTGESPPPGPKLHVIILASGDREPFEELLRNKVPAYWDHEVVKAQFTINRSPNRSR